MKTKSLMFVAVLLLSAFAVAQSTPYSNKVFSATFVGPVTETAADRNMQNTSTSVFYNAAANGVYQSVSIRTVDHDIPVDQSSLDFYADGAAKNGYVQDDRKNVSLQGHIGIYINLHNTDITGTTRRRVWYIIVSPRQVLALMTEGDATVDDGAVTAWTTFTESFVLNEKTCWLPEGCK